MKRLLITLTVIALSASCFAQGKEGHLSIIPRIGVDLAKITNGEYFVAESNSDFKVDANIRPAFACGIDAEYMLNSHFALNAGVYYTQQGAKFDDYSIENEDKTGYGVHNNILKLDYISMPLMAREFITDNFSVSIGLQPSLLVNTCRVWEEQAFVVGEEGARDYKKAEEIETDFSNLTQKFVLHMPVSISYEFQHVIIDARYVYGLTRSFKSSFGKSNNSMLMFTVGYRFQL